jgi:Protein of unknown function with HXXEE motif
VARRLPSVHRYAHVPLRRRQLAGNIDGVALVNTAYVWLPMALAAIFPQTLRWVGLAWIGLTLINGIIHVVTTIRLRLYNPGLVTSIVLFLPFTIFALALAVERHADRRRRRADRTISDPETFAVTPAIKSPTKFDAAALSASWNISSPNTPTSSSLALPEIV